MTFKDGDRVLMVEPQSKYTGKVGTVKGYSSSTYRELKVQFDCNADGHLVYFPPHYFKKEENTLYKINDRVIYNRKNHVLSGSLATVIYVSGEYLTVQFDSGNSLYDHMRKFDLVNRDNMYKIGDRVKYVCKDHKHSGKMGTVSYVDLWNKQYITADLDDGTYVYDNIKEFDPVNKVDNYKHYTEVAYNVKCAEWFKSAYASITKAGGVPEHVIDKLPADVLDTLIKNNLHLEYKP